MRRRLGRVLVACGALAAAVLGTAGYLQRADRRPPLTTAPPSPQSDRYRTVVGPKRASPDGGATWLARVQVNETPGKGELEDVRYWSGLAADAEGRFHPLWTSDATGVRQLWSAVVEVVASSP